MTLRLPTRWKKNVSAEANRLTYDTFAATYNTATATYDNIVVGDETDSGKQATLWSQA